ncbi:MAG: hypothetical protein WC220_05845, partial [Pedobacter sp.]
GGRSIPADNLSPTGTSEIDACICPAKKSAESRFVLMVKFAIACSCDREAVQRWGDGALEIASLRSQ